MQQTRSHYTKFWLYLALTGFFMTSYSANASLLKNKDPGKIIEKIQTYQSVEANLQGQATTLPLVGAAVRTRKILVHINVYVGEYFKNETAQAIRLTFLRDVDSKRIVGAFEDSLKVNNVDMNKPGIKKFLDAVSKSGESQEKSTLVIVGSKTADGTDQIIFENGRGEVTSITEATGLVADLFSIWLGKASDEGLLELQKAIKK